MSGSRAGRFLVGAGALALALLALSCASPNRGRWSGTFDGNVSGVVEFEINTRGTRLEGRMEGETRDGQPFRAELEGTLRQDFLDADFEGSAGTGLGLPLSFTGAMLGSLESALGSGEWECTLRSGLELSGTWKVEQVGGGDAR